MSLTDALRGITCPTVTPLRDGSIDEDGIAALVDHLERGGIDAVFPCGTTGEFASLSSEERRRAIEVTVERADVPVLAGASATSVAETVDHVEAAADAGADAAVVLPPYYTTASDPAGNRRFFEAVLDRVSLPVLLYTIPQVTGGRLEPETVATLAEREEVLGIKDSSGDLSYLLELRRRTPEDFLLLQGYDALLVPALRSGCDGGINAGSNVLPDVYAEAVDRAGDDRGRALQDEAIAPLFDACAAHGFAPASKAALVHLGVIASDEVRPPLVPVDDPEPIGEAVDAAIAAADR